MITKSVVAPFVLSLVAVLVPLAAGIGIAVIGVLAAVVWMSAVHALLARLAPHGEPQRFPVAERADSVSRGGTPSP